MIGPVQNVSPLHNNIHIILTLKKKKGKKTIRINTNGDTISGNHGTCKSVNTERQYKLVAKAFKMEITRRIQLRVTKNTVHTLFKHKQVSPSVFQKCNKSIFHSPVLNFLLAASDHLS